MTKIYLSKIINLKLVLLLPFVIFLFLSMVSIISIAYAEIETARVDDKVVENINLSGKTRVIVTLKDTRNGVKDRDDVLSNLSNVDIMNIRKGESELGWFSAEITNTGLQKLKQNPRVLRIIDPQPLRVLLSESVPLINGDDVWNLGYNGTGLNICIVDSGINASHADLLGKIVGQKCFCTISDYGNGGCCPNKAAQDSNATDDNGHGTHVAGIVVANGNINGVAKGAQIITVKVCNATGSCDPADVASGIHWCAASTNASVISVSLGSGRHDDPSECDAEAQGQEINLAVKNGKFVSVASGNEGFINGTSSPACASGATSVGMTYDKHFLGMTWSNVPCTDIPARRDTVTCASNRAKILDLLAPGALINSTTINGRYEEIGGTSMAAPHVAGAAALLQDAYNRTLTPDQIEKALKYSGEQIWDSRVRNNRNGTGMYFPRINVERALQYLELLDIFNTDWPTYQHDNRRTGFTLLKGDMSNAEDVEQLDLLFEYGRETDLASRTVVGDLDNNGHEDVLVWSARGTMEDPDAWLYVFEMQDRGQVLKLRQRGSLHVGDFSNGAPIIADTDGDGNKEIIVGLVNGTVYVIDFTVNGKDLDLYLKWSQGFTVPEYYDVRLDDWMRGMVGIAMAAADLDHDGTTEILFTDFIGPGYDLWPGGLYVLHDAGNQYALVTNITVRNGGSKGGVSLANVDDDDDLEIIVGAYYGLQVYDFVNNRLSLKWQDTSFGSYSGAPVIYDYDRDNQYEILVTTSVSCSYYKTCSNSFYVFDAATGNREKWLLLSFFSPFTVSVANLDTDNNVEAALSFTYTIETDKGGIACIDVNGGGIDCNYTNGNSFLNPGYAPVIADIDGNGDNEIIIPENNKSIMHVINGDGTQLFNYSFGGLIGSSPAIADIDNDGRAEIVVKRAGSPYSIMSTLGSNNHQPYIEPMQNMTAIAGQVITLHPIASDPDNDTVTMYYSAPFNDTGAWMPTNNDTGDYTILIEASDGNLSYHQYVPIKVLPEGTQVINVFADGSTNKTLIFTEPGQVQRVTIKIPKHAKLVYSTMKIEGKPAE